MSIFQGVHELRHFRPNICSISWSSDLDTQYADELHYDEFESLPDSDWEYNG